MTPPRRVSMVEETDTDLLVSINLISVREQRYVKVEKSKEKEL
jgi:hypothetical protein